MNVKQVFCKDKKGFCDCIENCTKCEYAKGNGVISGYIAHDLLCTLFGKNYDLDRLREMVEADRENRCVILPIEIGSFAYIPMFGMVLRFELVEIKMLNYIQILTFVHGKITMFFTADDIGKNIFLTIEGAEKALERVKKK